MSGSTAARRPQAKAALFIATSTPFSSIARSIAAEVSGIAADCHAKPSMNMLVAIASPRSAVAISVASIVRVRSAPARPVIAASSRRCRQRHVGVAGELARIGLVGVDEDTGAVGVDRGQRLHGARDHHVAGEDRIGAAGGHPDRLDASRGRRDADVAGHRPALLGKAGHVDDADALPLEMRRHGEDRADGDDAGAADAGDQHGEVVHEFRRRDLRQQRNPASVERACRFAPCTVTKLGQNPLRQEKSLLQDDWSIARFRPNSVSTGTMATQFDCTPQSPQPSQTSSLMTTRTSGSGCVPRFRRRRFSAAQVWS